FIYVMLFVLWVLAGVFFFFVLCPVFFLGGGPSFVSAPHSATGFGQNLAGSAATAGATGALSLERDHAW
ncbi:hypothetical protein, partial [Nocardia cyriacigeorgica]|uniref:hypothetical protein n=1 Tax=Nocardia cyriacigeorgica TaxID=135487 RepID=UPI002458657C